MMLAYPFRLAFALFILSFVIFFHELGHFATCKLFDIRTPVFSIGFGPPIVQKKFGDTYFRISMLPFGGYVSMNAHDLDQAPYWQKMVITLSGIFNNFLLSWLLLVLLFFLNRKKPVALENTFVSFTPIEQKGILTLFKQATSALFSMIKRSFYYIVSIFRPRARQQTPQAHPIAQLMQQSEQKRLSFLCYFIAIISVELGVFNAMPIPMLDGGQAVNYTLRFLTQTFLPGYNQILIHFIYLMLFIALLLYLNRRAGNQNLQ